MIKQSLRQLMIVLAAGLLTASIACGQKFSHEFGKYSAEEFILKKYDKDPDAEAVVIYDIGSSFFSITDDGFELVFERKTKIKILTKAGLKWANFAIPLYEGDRDLEILYDMAGNTYNYENGSVSTAKLNPQNIFEEKFNEHWHSKKFAMPDVKEGSVVEVTYKIRSPYLFNLRGWDFQYTIPVIYSEYVTKMVPFYEYVYILQGASKFDKYSSGEATGLTSQFRGITYKEMAYQFIMENLPAFKDEGYMTSMEDYRIKLNFQLAAVHRTDGITKQIMTTWPKLIEDVLEEESFGKFLKASQKNAQSIADTLNAKPYTAQQKAEIIHKYVKGNFNAVHYGSIYANKTAKEFLKTKTGNCSAINLFLTGALRAAGIEAYPVLISTRDHGKIPSDYPFIDFFNYTIALAYIDNHIVLLDATESLIPFGRVPTMCLNEKGLIVNKAKTEWMLFNNTPPSNQNTYLDLTFNSTNDSITIAYNGQATGYDALTLRKAYLVSHEKFKEKLWGEELSLADTLQVKNVDQIEKPLEINFQTHLACENIGGKILVAPFCGQAIASNPFKQASRTYPIDMVYKKDRKFITIIHIPQGYKVVNKPEDMSIKNAQADIFYQTEMVGSNILKISGSYTFKKEVYDATEYTYVKFYYNKIIDKFNEKIVLAKE